MGEKFYLDRETPLGKCITDFLADLSQANRSAHTCRAYAADLSQFKAFHSGDLNDITAEVLRRFAATIAHLSPSSRARKQAALASFLTWAFRQELIASDPMANIERVRAIIAQPLEKVKLA